jgi:hypothetical protein
VHTSRGTQAIETIRIGQRVITYLPHERTEPEPEEPTAMEWAAHRVITLLLPCEDEQWIRMQLLRDPDWFRMMAPEVGDMIFLDMPEMGVEGDAIVEAIEPCPEIEIGEGRVVTATFHHSSGECLELDIEGEDEPLRVTAGHPIWRVDIRIDEESVDERPLCEHVFCECRQPTNVSSYFNLNRELQEEYGILNTAVNGLSAIIDRKGMIAEVQSNWASACAFQFGDKVSTQNGNAMVLRIRRAASTEQVVNIEVAGDHVYRVTTSGILVHNASPVIPGRDYGCENPAGSGNNASCSGTQLASKLGGCPADYQAHHLIPCALKSSLAVKRAAELGFDINGKINGWCLPTDPKSAAVTGKKKLPVHCGWDGCHSEYNECARTLLDKLEADRQSGIVNDCNLCSAVARVIDTLRTALAAHKIWLNKNDPNKGTWRCPSTY